MKTKKRAASHRNLSGVEAALSAKCEEYKQVRARGNHADVRHKYDCAKIVHDLMNLPDKYGKAAVVTLAKRLRLDKSGLYKDAKVTTVWSAATAARTAKSSGGSVTWSHLAVLASVTNETKRAALLKAVQAERLSVSELEKRLDGRGSKELPDAKNGEVAFGHSVSRVVAEVAGFNGRKPLLDAFLKTLATVDPKVGAAELEELKQLQAALGEAADLARTSATTVAAAVDRLEARAPALPKPPHTTTVSMPVGQAPTPRPAPTAGVG